tara:strand:+ start:1128 stop:1439 length:312 start_codon:yes stop_codon:yes gene_type:complete
MIEKDYNTIIGINLWQKEIIMKLKIGQNWNMAKYQSGWRNGVLMEITELPDEGMNECIFLIDGKLETYWIGIDKDGNPYWNEEDKTIGMVYYGEHCLVMKSIN